MGIFERGPEIRRNVVRRFFDDIMLIFLLLSYTEMGIFERGPEIRRNVVRPMFFGQCSSANVLRPMFFGEDGDVAM